MPDLPGSGQSDEPVSFIHAQEYAASLLGFMRMNGLESVHLAAMILAVQLPALSQASRQNRIKTLTLIAANVFPDTPIPVPLRIAKIPGLGSLAFRMMVGRWGLSMMWWAAVANKKQFPWSRYRVGLEQPGIRTTASHLSGVLAQIAGAVRPDSGHVIQDLGSVCGDLGNRDPFFSTQVGRRTARAIPSARYVEIAGTGHFVP